MIRETKVLHESFPVATGSPTYGSCVFFVYPDLWLFYGGKNLFCSYIFSTSSDTFLDLDYALLGKYLFELLEWILTGCSAVTMPVNLEFERKPDRINADDESVYIQIVKDKSAFCFSSAHC